MTVRRLQSPPRVSRATTGAVLLEVVFALVLFVAAATIITAGMNASVAAVQRLRLSAHALNLAQSTLAEVQMQARTLESAGPEPFAPPFDDWMWRLDVTALESSTVEAEAMKQVEVTVWHTSENTVQRLAQIMRADDVIAPPESSSQASTNYFTPTPRR